MKQVHVTCITYKPCNERKDDVLALDCYFKNCKTTPFGRSKTSSSFFFCF